MYKKYAVMLIVLNLLIGAAFITEGEKELLLKLGERNEEVMAKETECIAINGYQKDFVRREIRKIIQGNEVISGKHPVLEVQSVQRDNRIILPEDEKMILYKIVEAEAGAEDRRGKILVANVILNRLESDSFPDSIEEVVFQQVDGVAQFSPVSNGKYDKAVPDEDTKEAVDAALDGEDYSQGALYFMARQYADEDNVKWFDNALEPVVVHGGHEFYK